VAGPFDLSVAPNALGLFLGDYHALASIGPTFVPFYVKANNGNLANRTDVFAGRVSSAGTLAKSAAGTAFIEAVPWIAEGAAPWVPAADVQQRLRATAQRVLDSRRLGHGVSRPAR
jgi:hypothetical protein